MKVGQDNKYDNTKTSGPQVWLMNNLVFDREVPSGLSMSFFLLLQDAFRQILILDKISEILILDKNSESLIFDKKTGKSHLG